MKKIFTLLIGILFSVTILNSQVAPPQAFSFKATIQGTKGQTSVNKIIRLRISILQDDMNGFPVYSEFFTPTTDHYSQVNVEIGRGNVLSGIFSSIDWSAHTYFLKIEVDAKGGTSYQMLSSTQLLSVPYALYAGKAGNTFSGEYGELIGAPVLSLVATTGQYSDLSGKPTLFSGSYNDLIDKPTFFSGNYNELSNKPTLFDGTWNSLTGKPTFSAIVLSGSWKDLISLPTTLTGYGITDAINTSHPANGISATNITNWNTAFSWGDHAGLYKPLSYVPSWIEITGKPTGNNQGDMQYWNGTNWILVNVGSDGQVLTLINGIPTWRSLSSPCADPIIITTAVTSITPYTALNGGSITSDGGCPVTARGLCYGTSLDPTLAGPKTVEGQGTGTFTSTMIGLSPGTQYHVRAYATISNSTIYGNDMTFTTNIDPNANWQPGNPWIDPLDGHSYKTIQYGYSTWMAENLRATKYCDGNSIALITDSHEWELTNKEGYCWYNNDFTTYGNTYGALYNWYAVQTNKLCPFGWHVSNISEWENMIILLGGANVAGDKLKELGTTHWESPNAGASNEIGFTALPSGERNFNGNFMGLSGLAVWWSSDRHTISGNYYFIDSSNSVVRTGTPFGEYPNDGYSVRCVKN